MLQFQRRDKDLKEVILYLQPMQFKKKKHYNEKYGIREKLTINSIVLLYNIRCKKDLLQKLAFKWLGSNRIYNAIEKKKDVYA